MIPEPCRICRTCFASLRQRISYVLLPQKHDFMTIRNYRTGGLLFTTLKKRVIVTSSCAMRPSNRRRCDRRHHFAETLAATACCSRPADFSRATTARPLTNRRHVPLDRAPISRRFDPGRFRIQPRHGLWRRPSDQLGRHHFDTLRYE